MSREILTQNAMKFELSQSFSFEAAHTLTRTVPLAEFQGSKRIHGHSYFATVTLIGEKGKDGMLQYFKLPRNKAVSVDLFYLNERISKIRGKLDHMFLDEVEGLGAPTLENLASFIFQHVANALPVLSVTVSRPTSGDSCKVVMK